MTIGHTRPQDLYPYIAKHATETGEEGEGWSVWHVPLVIRMSDHESKRGAWAAIKRYKASDARRLVSSSPDVA